MAIASVFSPNTRFIRPRTPSKPLRGLVLSFLLLLISCPQIAFTAITPSQTNNIIKSHAIAMHGSPKYPANFTQFEYTAADAVKGGSIRLHALGTFDSLNDFIAKGTPADELGLLYDSLTVSALDEPLTQYGLLAKTLEYPEDRSWIIFHLREEARFHDGHPVHAEDVVFTFNLLMEKGNPAYKFFYADVEKVEALDQYRVQYRFKTKENRELALSVGQLPVLPKHFWENKAFDESSLEIPLGSGPYKVAKLDPGRSITYQRIEDYWGLGLPVNRGQYNFDTVNVDYYRDTNVAIEALKAGEYDYRWENSSKFWATAYDIPAVQKGELIKKEVPHQANSGIQSFVFNTRRSIFQDRQLRQAISYAFDFEWSNQTLFYGAYERSYSYFSNSDFAARDLPSEEELALLEPFRDLLPDDVFTKVYKPPVSDGSGRNRPNLRIAKKLLDEAGYYVKDNQLYNKDGLAINFEILLVSPAFERIVNPFIKGLSRLGIGAQIRLVDVSQYINRSRSFDFDVLVKVFPQSESPGNEQRNLWGSEAADTEGSGNIIGIKNPVIDSLIENITNAVNREELVIATRALDRVLLHEHYTVPQWYKASSRIVYWNKFGIPNTPPIYDRYYSQGIHTWWYIGDNNRTSKVTQATQMNKGQ